MAGLILAGKSTMASSFRIARLFLKQNYLEILNQKEQDRTGATAYGLLKQSRLFYAMKF